MFDANEAMENLDKIRILYQEKKEEFPTVVESLYNEEKMELIDDAINDNIIYGSYHDMDYFDEYFEDDSPKQIADCLASDFDTEDDYFWFDDERIIHSGTQSDVVRMFFENIPIEYLYTHMDKYEFFDDYTNELQELRDDFDDVLEQLENDGENVDGVVLDKEEQDMFDDVYDAECVDDDD